jgi:predicted metal-dependent phosphoesterase TrpH
MTARTADLHLHTHFSDGTYSPEELAGHAQDHHLAAIALTDHDTVEGCPRMQAACETRGIEFIPGAELTADVNGQEVHILGYWLDTTSAPLLSELLRFQTVRQQRIHEMVARLNSAGFALRVEDVLAAANCSAPGRPHMARALVDAGHANDYDHAFDRFLKKGRVGWVPKARMSATDAVRLIHDARGVAVLAHPGLYRNDGLIPHLVQAGMDGIECWHTRHSPGACEHYARVAAQNNLVATGGSDCHGMAKGEPLIGSIHLPYSQVEALQARRPASIPSSPA